MFNYALFDLDGTLTEPKEGICKSVQYALHKMGIEEENLDKLEPFIGPPLIDSFKQFYNMSEEDAKKAQDYYRERFSVVGKFENKVYPGIPEMLGRLKENGIKLAVASSKPQIFVDEIMEHFDLAKYFEVIVGSDIDGPKKTKTDVVRAALEGLYGGEINEDYKKLTIMVGDRCFDIEGAHNLGIKGLGVEYGYAPKGELKKAGADMIAKTVEGVGQLIIGVSRKRNKDNKSEDKSAIEKAEKKDLEKKAELSNDGYSKPVPEKSFFRAIYVVSPYAFYYVVLMAAMTVCLAVAERAGINNIMGSSWFVSGAISGISSLIAGILLIMVYHKSDPLSVRLHFSIPYGLGAGALLALGLNLIFGLICQIFPALNQYTGSAMANADMPLSVRIICYVIISPFAEELIFRYMLYGRMKRFLGTFTAVFFSSVFFGLYHGQVLQGIYAFIMGIFMALIYEWSGTFLSTFGFHMAANLIVTLSPYIPKDIQKIVASIPMALVYVTAGVYLYLLMYKKNSTANAKPENKVIKNKK